MPIFTTPDLPFFKNDGSVNSFGTAYFGAPDTNAKTNQKQPYLDRELTTPANAVQALTAGGKLAQTLFYGEDYSLIIEDSDAVQINEYLSILPVFQSDSIGGLAGFEFATVATMGTRTTTGGDVIAPVLGYRFSTLGFYSNGDGGGADYVVTNDTADGRGKIDLGGGFTATLINNGQYANVLQYGATENGASEETSIFSAAVDYNGSVLIPEGVEVLVNGINLDLKRLLGGGKLSYTTTSAFPGDTYNMNNDIEFKDITLECRQRNRLNIESNNINLINVTEKLNTSDTDAGAYTNINWMGTETFSTTNHTSIDTGIKINDTGVLNINGAILKVNDAGLGVGTGIDDGTDAIKISTGSGNISNVVVEGCSRDVIDAFVSTGEMNINNIQSDKFVINIIELKIQDSQGTSEIPKDINISNVFCGAGGIQENDNFAGLLIVNARTTYSDTYAPRRINVTNWNCRDIGQAQSSGNYYGCIVEGGYDINLINFNTGNVKSHGLSIGPNVHRVKIANSNIHADDRAISVNGVTEMFIENSVIGEDYETGNQSTYGLFGSGASSLIKINNSKVRGTTNSIRAESATINEFKCVGSTLLGAWRVDNFDSAEFSASDVVSQSSSVNTISCLGSGVSLKITGGSVKDGQRGLSRDNIDRFIINGVTFDGNSSVMFGTSGTDDNILVGCVSNGSGSFPTATGAEQFANNIVV